MLPKPEKNKKNQPQQLDLVNSISSEEKISSKRRFVVIFLLLTVGLSFVFWAYRSIKTVIDTQKFPRISLNLNLLFKKNTNPVKSDSLDSKISLILENQQPANWYVYVQALGSPETFTWKHDPTGSFSDYNDPSVIQSLMASPVSESGPIASILPAGAKVQELFVSETDSIVSCSLITVPQKQIIMIIKVSQPNTLNNPENTLKIIAEKIYWHILQLSS